MKAFIYLLFILSLIENFRNKYNNKIKSIIIFIFFNIFSSKNVETNKLINSSDISHNNTEYFFKKNSKSIFNGNHLRYHFQEKLNNTKKFEINYDFKPYSIALKNLGFKYDASFIYNSTGMLNITKLEYYYKKNRINLNVSKLNHIHISMSFNNKYADLSLISISSILNTSNIDTYIHFHILGLNFSFYEIQKIIALRKINNKVEFIFYNAKQAEFDFDLGLKDRRGIGNYAKILIPQIINNTDKILILDSGDILCQKDLSELFFYDIGDNYFGWILDHNAGNNLLIKSDKFMTNYFHPNTGVFLVNIKLFKKDELYKKAVFMSKSYNYFRCPTQDILITISNYKFQFIPLKYNIHIYYNNDKERKRKIKTKAFKKFLRNQRFSPYKYTIDEIHEAMKNPVIYHFITDKIQYKNKCDRIMKKWLYYANLSGVYEKLKVQYPRPFSCVK